MALVCSKCSAENGDGSLVCRHCGAALPPPISGRSLLPEDDQFDPLSAPTLVMQHTAPAPLPPIEETAVPRPERKSGRTLLLGLATGALIVAVGVWLLRPGEPAAPAAVPSSDPASARSAVVAALPAPAESPAPTAAPAAPPPAAPATASAPIAVTAAASAAPVHAAASTALDAASAVVTDTRKRIPEPVARKRALSATPATAPAASAAPTPAPTEPLAAAPAAPSRPKTVAELCAAGNLITRGFCEQRECRRAEHAADPLCVKLKDAEQRRLFQQ